MNKKSLTIMRRLLTFVRPMRTVMAIAVLFGIIGHLTTILMPALAAAAIAAIIKGEPWNILMLGIILCAVLRGTMRYVEQACNHWVAFRLLAHIRHIVFAKLREIAPAKLDTKDRGDLIAMITTDIELLEVFFAHTISPIIIALAITVMMVVFLARVHLVLAVIAFVAYLAIGCLLPCLLDRSTQAHAATYRSRFGMLNSFMVESIEGLFEIKQLNQTENWLTSIKIQTETLNQAQRAAKRRHGLSRSLSDGIILLTVSVFLAAGIQWIRLGILSPASLAIALVATFSSFGPVLALANLSINLQQTLASGQRIIDLLDEPALTPDIRNGQDLDSLTSVSFENVSFDYGTQPVLCDVDLHATKDSLIAITGPSGSGKSTLIKLLMRFWESKNGMIRLSGHDINTINTASLRQHQSTMSQQTDIFHDTLANNIRIGKPDASMLEIIDVAKKAALHDFVLTLEHGYETMISAKGHNLSSGEKQRIALARLLIHDSDVILLDEPTSHLDSLNEALILKSLVDHRHDKIILYLSHRQYTTVIADEVWAIHDGQLQKL